MKTSLITRLRAWGSLRMLRRMNRAMHRLPVTLREIDRGTVLVVAPHMDDEVIGPGGTLALHRQHGSDVHIVFCAAGADAELDAVRRREGQAAADFLGAGEPCWLNYPDGRLAFHEERLAVDLCRLLGETRPDQLFCPFPTDHHRDHTAAASAVAAAIRQSGWDGEVWSYEVWSPLWPNAAVDISSVVESKRQAIALHESQVAGLHYVDGILGLNRYRGLRVYVDYAETFFVASAGDFVQINARANLI